jgi:hypothetical protein
MDVSLKPQDMLTTLAQTLPRFLSATWTALLDPHAGLRDQVRVLLDHLRDDRACEGERGEGAGRGGRVI